MAAWAPTVSAMGSSGSHPVPLWFRWDGVVVDDFDRARTALKMVLRSRSLPDPPYTEKSMWLGSPFEDLFDQIGVPLRVRVSALAQWNGIMAAFPAPLQPGIAELFAELGKQEHRVGALSRASSAVIEADAARYHLADTLGVAYGETADITGPLKRHGAGQPPRSMVFVGYTEDDIRAAKAAGALPVGFAQSPVCASRLKSAGAEHIVDDLAYLLDICPVSDLPTF